MKIQRPYFEKMGGIIPVIVVQDGYKEVLMHADTDEECFLESMRTGRAVYYSTSRRCRWLKGEASGNFQYLRRVGINCGGDALLYVVHQKGDVACHTGCSTCFFRNITGERHIMGGVESEGEKLDTIDIGDMPDWIRFFGK